MVEQADPTDEPHERTPKPEELGSARDTLRIPDFRRVFIASFTSSLGRWMQNVALGVFAWKLSGSPSFTTFIVFAQMFPLLALSVIGGSLADSMDRRTLLVVTQAWQAVWGLILAWQVLDGEIGRELLVGIVFMIGIGQALFAPAFTAVVPSLVGPKNLSAAISLNSMQVNGSRVIGPAIGGVLVTTVGISAVFALNSVTYLLIIGALMTVDLPPAAPSTLSRSDRLLGGLRLARLVPQVGRPLGVMVLFSLLCLPFIGLMPVLAAQAWGVDPESTTYSLIYSAFGCGALGGAVAAGTVLLRISREAVVRGSLAFFAVALSVLATLESPVTVAPVIFLVGLFYFTMPTALSTYLQEHLADEVRGRVMALWVISFGGIVAITNLVSGKLVEWTSLEAVILAGGAAAALLAFFVRLPPGSTVGDEVLHAERARRNAAAEAKKR